MKPNLITIVLVAALIGCAGCDRSRTGPSPTPTPTTPTAPTPPAAAPQVTKIAIEGKLLLTTIGETSPLAATATLSDGTTKDVTTAVQWTAGDRSVLTVSAAGMVTVLRFGSSYVTAVYVQKYATVNVQATPSGTFVVSGRVREPGSSGLGGVQVRDDVSGASMVSGDQGEFSFGGLIAAARFSLEKEGYERVAIDGKQGTYVDVAMQRLIRIAAGGKVNVGLAPHDMDYEVAAGSHCYPCKMIRVTTAGTTQLHLGVTWAEPHATLNLWINGQLFEGAAHGPSEAVADVTAGPGELIVYVGMKSQVEYYAPFTLTTAVVK
jgi:hypothetical protein